MLWLGADKRTLTVVLPAFNEEENIQAAVAAVRDVVSTLVPEWECIVVDDGSSDATWTIVERLTEQDPHIRLISFPANRGYGSALREGFAAARGELVFFTDSDRQFDVRELRYFLPLLEHSDAVFGFRVYRYDGILRGLLSWVYNRMVRVLFRVKVRDVDCSFKLFRREVLESIDLESDDFFIDTELTAKTRKWNFRISEKGVRHYPRAAGESTVRASDIPRTLRTIGRMWVHMYLPTLKGRRTPVCPLDYEPLMARSDSQAQVLPPG